MDTETNLAQPEVEVEELPEFEGSTEPDDADTPEGESEEAEEETAEIERDGKTFKIPAALKDDFLRQADYTRKTQELAETRKELASHIEQAKQASEGEINARAKAVAIDAAIQQYDNVDWDALQARDANLAFEHWRKFQQLQTAKVEADGEYTKAVETRTLAAQQEAAKRIEQGVAELHTAIPDWGPEKAEQLMTFGEKQFGMTRQYMESVDDPNLIKVMNFAFLASKAPQSKPAAEPLKPAAKIRGGTVPAKGLDDRASIDDWVKAREAQLRRK